MTGLPLFDRAESEAAKQLGLGRAVMTNLDFVKTMRVEARKIAERRGTVHIDEVRARAEELGLAPVSSSAWGAVFAERGKWRKVGYRPSAWVGNHGHVSPCWELVE